MRVLFLALLMGCGGKVAGGEKGIDLSPEPEPNGVVEGATSKIAAGGVHTCVISSGVRCAGAFDGATHLRTVAIDGLSDAQQIAAGATFTCARMKNGTVRCFGNNDGGQLGDGTKIARSTPVRVRTLVNVVEIATGAYHACARNKLGEVWCWGLGYDGQLGDGDSKDAPVAVKVKGISGATAISAGWTHSCAALGDGRVQCWGANHRGQLGTGNLVASPVPKDVVGLVGRVSALAAGEDHNCVLVDAGQVMCWGRNFDGQIGDGSDVNRPSAVKSNVPPAKAITLGKTHTCAVLLDGSAWCWGANRSGQLGVGDNTPSRLPRRVAFTDPVTSLDIGHDHGCLESGARVLCFGEGSDGRLGTGDEADRAAPVPATF
jgi:alpha-tubulin suppressor-like RCC1 family protein